GWWPTGRCASTTPSASSPSCGPGVRRERAARAARRGLGRRRRRGPPVVVGGAGLRARPAGVPARRAAVRAFHRASARADLRAAGRARRVPGRRGDLCAPVRPEARPRRAAGRRRRPRRGGGRAGRRVRRARRPRRPARGDPPRAAGAGDRRAVHRPAPGRARARGGTGGAEMISTILLALGMGLLGAVVFSAIGLVSGTDETATLAPLTLLVVLVGVPPAGVLAFFLAGAVAKHMTHMVPTTLLGIPGDTMAVPLLREADLLRRLGVPHIALHKALSGAAISALIAVPVAVGAAARIAPFADQVTAVAPYVFPVAAAVIAYFSRGRWAAVAGLVPMVLVIAALQAFVKPINGSALSISFFLGIAIGPLVADLFRISSPLASGSMRQQTRRSFFLAPDV